MYPWMDGKLQNNHYRKISTAQRSSHQVNCAEVQTLPTAEITYESLSNTVSMCTTACRSDARLATLHLRTDVFSRASASAFHLSHLA